MRHHKSRCKLGRQRTRVVAVIMLSLFCTTTLAPPALAQIPMPSDATKPDSENETVPRRETAPEMRAYLDQVVDPVEYRVGPGDVLAINIWTERPQQYSVMITPEATVIVPTIGEISVSEMTLAQLKSAVIERLRSYYSKANATVTLTEIRRFRVAVSGAVNIPGLYVVSANTRASEALTTAGLSATARRRGIELRRRGGQRLVDLDAFERRGFLQANPYLTEGDVLFVPSRDIQFSTISVSGAVFEQATFDFLPGDSVGDLLDLAYGLTSDADTNNVELWRFLPDVDSARHYTWPPGSSYSDWRKTPLRADDRLIVRARVDYRPKEAVEVIGEVYRPGQYVFTGDSVMLKAVIDSAGGITQYADLEHAFVTRTQIPNWSQDTRGRLSVIPADLRSRTENDWMLADALAIPGRVVTDFKRLIVDRDEAFNIALFDGDRIWIPRRSPTVNVLGRVAQPGLVPHEDGADLQYYLNRAGGFSWQADRGRTFLLKGATGAAIRRSKIASIEPGDTIVIPTRRPRNLWASVRETLVVFSSLATIYLVIDQATN